MSKGYKGKISNSLVELNACKVLLKNLMSPTYKKLAWIFYEPVDPQTLGLDDYLEIVKEPMDFGTIKQRLDADDYKDAMEFAKDVRLIFFNAYLYTNSDHVCYKMAKELQLIFEKMFTELLNNSAELMEIADKEAVKDRKSIHSFDDDEIPLTAEEDLDLHAKIEKLDGEHLLKVIHLIRQMEGTKATNKELEIDVLTLKTRTKRAIENFMASKNITGKRRTSIKYQN
ncbi:uncharacterized protein Dwil_GK19581 [Drosophila willistoni]|uniref:Bromo domain-containing protein n=1 Tax=Drosophila willistoni TaxID=7260 RepID=B4MNI4_DROWI|nr:uncharacterized protein Dwil_GK19581 [Drosophila willistoni]